jgi:hypothetical protein
VAGGICTGREAIVSAIESLSAFRNYCLDDLSSVMKPLTDEQLAYHWLLYSMVQLFAAIGLKIAVSHECVQHPIASRRKID